MAPDGIKTFPALNYRPEYVASRSVVCRRGLGYGESPRLLPSRFTSALDSLTVSFEVGSGRTPTVAAAYGDLRGLLVSVGDLIRLVLQAAIRALSFLLCDVFHL